MLISRGLHTDGATVAASPCRMLELLMHFGCFLKRDSTLFFHASLFASSSFASYKELFTEKLVERVLRNTFVATNAQKRKPKYTMELI